MVNENLLSDEELKEHKIKTSVFFISANCFEQFTLWQQHRDIWVEDLCGFSEVIGHIDGDKEKPINVSFSFAKLYGKRICFYYVCSRYNDIEMVEEFIWKNYPVKYDKGTRRAMTNATNFHHAIDACKEHLNETN